MIGRNPPLFHSTAITFGTEPATPLSAVFAHQGNDAVPHLKESLLEDRVLCASDQLLSEKLITGTQHSILQQRLFQVRDGIITLMGEYRAEWRRRFGSEGYCR